MDTPFGNGLDFRIGGNGGQGAPRLPVDHRCIDKISGPNMKKLPQPNGPTRCREFRIGAIGAGFIMSEVQLEAYREANFSVLAIASRTRSKAEAAAKRYGII